MTKLHEILAVEGTKEKVVNKLLKESLHTLNKETLFSGAVRKLEMFREEDKNSENTDYQELTTTVDENLEYLIKPISEWLDVVFTKEKTNQEARADLVVNGQTLGTNIPATFLLGLETKLVKIREVYEAIPTLLPGTKWIPDNQNRNGVFIAAHDTVQMKSKKDPEFRVVVEATPHHPAQVEKVDRTLDVGRYVTTLYSGRMTPLEKANRLTRIDELLSAVKSARMRANNVNIITDNIGNTLLDFINKG